MKKELHRNKKRRSLYSTYDFLRLVLFVVALSVVNPTTAQVKKKSGTITRSVSSYVPSEYLQVGNTLLYYRQMDSSIDIIGQFGTSFYGSTYSNRGYKVAMKVDDHSAIDVDCLNGTVDNGVSFLASVEQQGELARICYAVTNTNEVDVMVSLGTHADVMIGDNDRAPISRKIDTIGNTYGLTMKDGNGAQLCVLFGSGLAGVTSVSDFWFGGYYTNIDANSMVGDYSPGSNYMEEDGAYDSGMGWCWKERVIPAGRTVVFSYLIGVGDVNLEPSSTFEVTPDDPEGWNDISRPHRLTLEGEYESPAGLEGRIEYAVEDEEEWHALTEMLKSGDTFSESLIANFDVSKHKHVIRFRTVDNVGNATMLPSIEYLDVSYYPVTGIIDKTYTGDSLYQTDLVCDIDADKLVMSHYLNNVNVGMATFYAEGLFPYTIGRKAYTFRINPAQLIGDILLEKSEFVYTGEPFTPEWTFTESRYDVLKKDKDYQIMYENNIEPGTGVVNIEGIGNYTGVLSQTFFIDKAPLTEALYSVTLPEKDISYDEQTHSAIISKKEGVGEAVIEYCLQGEESCSTDAPSYPGHYDIYLKIADGTLYYGLSKTKIGSFSIYHFDESEWTVLETLREQLAEKGWTNPWDMSQGAKSITSFEGLKVLKGHVVGLDLSSNNITGDFPWDIFKLSYLEELDLSDNNLSGDIGAGMQDAVGVNPGMTANIRTINISNNKFFGNIAMFANGCMNLQKLYASDNCMSDVIPFISSAVTELDLSRQTINKIINLDLSNLNPEVLMSTFPTILIYDHETQSYKNNLSLLCTTSEISDFEVNNPETCSVVLSYANGQFSIPYISEQNAYYGESGDLINVVLLNNDYTQEGTTFKISLNFATGDANFNGKIDVTDLQAIILRIFDNYNEMPFNYTAANMVKDDVLNVQDVVGEVNLLLADDVTVAAPKRMANANGIAEIPAADASVYCNDGELKMYSSVPVAAFDIVVDKASSLSVCARLTNLGLTCAVKETATGTHIIGYSLTGGYVPAGETTIGSFSGNGVSVSYAVLSDEQANRIPVAINSETTAIGNVGSSMPDVTIADGKLIINSNGTDGNVEWMATALDGRILGMGTVSGHGGSNAIDLNVYGVVIVTLKSDGMKVTKKLINNR